MWELVVLFVHCFHALFGYNYCITTIVWGDNDDLKLQDNRPTGTIPLAGNKIIRHPDDPKQQQGFKFEIQCKLIQCIGWAMQVVNLH